MPAFLYALGFLGLFGVTLLPLRACRALQRLWPLWHTSVSAKVALLVVAATAVTTVSLGMLPVADVFLCLTGNYCGANPFQGWLYLCHIGIFYLAFECVATISLGVARRTTRKAT